MAKLRIQREYKKVMESDEVKNSGIKIELVDDNYHHLKGTFAGPDDSPYKGASFKVDIVIPDNYPFSPPKAKFLTKIWHPNISSVTGAICLDILKDKWAAVLTLRTVLLSLQALLTAPEPDDPQDGVVAKQYKDKQELFKKTAQYWAACYAGATYSHPEFDEKIKKMKEGGTSEEAARVALSNSDWDIEEAKKKLED